MWSILESFGLWSILESFPIQTFTYFLFALAKIMDDLKGEN